MDAAVEGTVTSFLNRALLAIDERDYDFVRTCFAGKVHFDSSSLGGAALDLSRDQMIAGLEMTFRYLKGTQHLLGALVVTDEAEGMIDCVAQYQAYHYRDDLAGLALWVHGGRHHYRLRRIDGGLEIESLRVEMAWTWGDQAVISTPPLPA